MLRFSISAIATFLIAGFVAAQVPSVMNYQGRLTDNTPSQDPITDILPIEFRIYGSAMGQDLVWSESWGAVDVVDGVEDDFVQPVTIDVCNVKFMTKVIAKTFHPPDFVEIRIHRHEP